MPAYFSIVIESSRTNIYPNILKDFYDVLQDGNMQNPHCSWQFMDMPYEEIIKVNQKKLEDNYIHGYEDDASDDYIQIMYDHYVFSEVRSFIVNRPDDGIFTIHTIIPEDELLTMKGGRICYDDRKIGSLIELAKKLWKLPFVDIIQTCLELSDDIDCLSNVRNGAALAVEPFAIVPGEIRGIIPDGFIESDIERDGILLTIS